MNIISDRKTAGRLPLLFFLASLLGSCGYSFTGASIAPDIKTVSIQYFPNYATLVQPTLSQLFTERLKDKFISQTTLSLVKNNGDLNFEGAITDYRTQPSAIQAGDRPALNQLVITVRVTFTNRKDEKQNFESSFTRFAEFESSRSLLEVEEDLIREINRQLVDDIFNKAVVNW
jgi:outer membrane lipopolysaccharide assembly protein LptE/RlpB